MASAAPVLATVQRLLDEQRFKTAVETLVAAADTGNATALAELAQWRIAGNLIRRDLAAARALLERAWAAGSEEAGLLYAGFLASAVGGPGDWAGAVDALHALTPRRAQAATQLRLIEAMRLRPDGAADAPIARRSLSQSPHVEYAEGLFTPQECAYLLAVGAPNYQRSLVADPRTGQMMPHPVRRSDAAMLGVHLEDVAVNALNRRIAAFSATDVLQGEPLQLLRYHPRDEYRTHLDVLPGEPNQRVMTVLVYLSDDYGGGETVFPRASLKVRGGVGDAILFRNVDALGNPDRGSEHAGLPVTRGTKYIASRWIRARRFAYPPPRPLLEV